MRVAPGGGGRWAMEWLIDGHNVIGQMPDIGLDDPDDEQKLLWRLRRYRARTGRRIVVVFDPGGAYHPAARRSKYRFM